MWFMQFEAAWIEMVMLLCLNPYKSSRLFFCSSLDLLHFIEVGFLPPAFLSTYRFSYFHTVPRRYLDIQDKIRRTSHDHLLKFSSNASFMVARNFESLYFEW
jgi:hypothetical protein